MKKLFLFIAAVFLSFSLLGQGNSGGKGKSKDNSATSQTNNPADMQEHGNGKNKVKDKNKGKEEDDKDNGEKYKQEKAKNDEHDRKVWDGVEGTDGCGKLSKKQPAKVRSSFKQDYPNAMNVRWSKCRGDWTASFGNGVFQSTAIYHANGERRDTRTPVTQKEMPKIILDSIFKKRPKFNLGDIIKIEKPGSLEEIFRLKDTNESGVEFLFFNKLGEAIKYDY